jgi:hypothetical protein
MVNKILGPTFPPLVKGNLAVLKYEGASFVFEYAENIELVEGSQRDLMLIAIDNRLAKVVL